MSKPTYQVETFDEAKEGIALLLHAHWHEVGLSHEVMPLNPDWEKYQAAYEAGTLLIATARLDGALIGYNVFFIIPHIHYKTTMVAMNDVLFLQAAHRRGRVGMQLIAFAETVLRERGVVKVFMHVKKHLNFGSLLGYLGYAPEETVWAKALTGGV